MKKALAIIAIIILVLFLTAGVWWHEINVIPTVSIPTQAMPHPNAYDYFIGAANLVVRQDDIDIATFYKPYNWFTFTQVNGHYKESESLKIPLTLAQKEALLRLNEPAVDKLRQGLSYPFMRPTIGLTVVDRSNSKFRKLARLLRVSSEVNAAAGNLTESMRSGLDAIQMGSQIPNGGDVIAFLSGMACEGIGRRPLWDNLPRLGASDARQSAIRLEAIDARQPSYADALQNSKRFADTALLPGFRSRHWLFDMLDWGSSARDLLRTLSTSKRVVMGQSDEYMDAEVAKARLPYIQAASLPPVPLPSDPFLYEVMKPWGSQKPKDRFDQDSFFSGCFKGVVSETENRLLMTSLALHAYRLDHGAYPASLNELVPHYLHAVPADPFALNSPLRYRRAGDKYVLYSIGPDGVDDGGKAIYQEKDTDGSLLRNSWRRYVYIDSKGDIVAGVNVD